MNIGDVRRELAVTRAEKARLAAREVALVERTVAAVRTDDGISTFERQRRSTYLRTWTDDDGMTNLRGHFDPVSGAAIASVLERRVEHMFHSGDDLPVHVEPGIEPNDHRRRSTCSGI